MKSAICQIVLGAFGVSVFPWLFALLAEHTPRGHWGYFPATLNFVFAFGGSILTVIFGALNLSEELRNRKS